MTEQQLAFELVITAGELRPPAAPKRARRARKTAREARDEGMAIATAHAEREHPTWTDKAVEWVRIYAMDHYEFMCEAVRVHAESFTFALPPDKRSWGTVMQKAAVKGYVEKVGLSYATDPKVHQNPAGLWRSRLCKAPK